MDRIEERWFESICVGAISSISGETTRLKVHQNLCTSQRETRAALSTRCGEPWPEREIREASSSAVHSPRCAAAVGSTLRGAVGSMTRRGSWLHDAQGQDVHVCICSLLEALAQKDTGSVIMLSIHTRLRSAHPCTTGLTAWLTVPATPCRTQSCYQDGCGCSKLTEGGFTYRVKREA